MKEISPQTTIYYLLFLKITEKFNNFSEKYHISFSQSFSYLNEVSYSSFPEPSANFFNPRRVLIRLKSIGIYFRYLKTTAYLK